MDIASVWAEALDISQDKLDEMRQLAPSEALLVNYCIENGVISVDAYLKWATEYFQTAVLNDQYFTTAIAQENIKTLMSDGNFSSAALPVGKFDDVIFLACSDPSRVPQYPFEVRALLANPLSIEKAWRDSLVTSEISAPIRTEPPATEEFEETIMDTSTSLDAEPVNESSQPQEESISNKEPVIEEPSKQQSNTPEADKSEDPFASLELGTSNPEPEKSDDPFASLEMGASNPEPEKSDDPFASLEMGASNPEPEKSDDPFASLELGASNPEPEKSDDPFASLELGASNPEPEKSDDPFAALKTDEVPSANNTEEPKVASQKENSVPENSAPENPAPEGTAMTAAPTPEPAPAPIAEVAPPEPNNMETKTGIEVDSTDAPIAKESPTKTGFKLQIPTSASANAIKQPASEPEEAPKVSAEASPEAPPIPNSEESFKTDGTVVTKSSSEKPSEPPTDNVVAMADKPPTDCEITVAAPAYLDEAISLEQSLSWFIKELHTKYTSVMFLVYDGTQFNTWKWDTTWKLRPGAATTIDTKEPSLFKITLRSKKPYHGKITQNPVHDKFFNDFVASIEPEVVTTVPVIQSGNLWGVILCVGSSQSNAPECLSFAESVGEKFNESLTTGQIRVA